MSSETEAGIRELRELFGVQMFAPFRPDLRQMEYDHRNSTRKRPKRWSDEGF